MSVTPLETLYHGVYFRSKTEARFAVFLDCLGIKWEYEPQGFDLGNGLKYLPDFKIMIICGSKLKVYGIMKTEN